MTTPAIPTTLQEFLRREFAGNPVQDWIVALAILVGVVVVLGLVKQVVALRLKKIAERTPTDLDDLLVDLVRRTASFFLLTLAVFVARHWLTLNDDAKLYVGRALKVALWIQVGLWGLALIEFGIRRMVHGRSAADPARTMGASVLDLIARGVVWSMVLLLCLDALGQNVTALIASLGVGGIAVALALQNILGDLFASITILLDKPFVVGDAIVLGDFAGTVERIGIKTTRLRSVSGEEIVIGNNDLVGSRVRNYKRMQERRSLFTIGVSYETPTEKLAAIPGMLKEIVTSTPATRFDRAHLRGFGSFTLDFEVVFYAQTPDLAAMMDAQQRINLEILKRFQQEGIEIAFPTQTLLLKGGLPQAPPPGPHGQIPGPPPPESPPQKELSRG